MFGADFVILQLQQSLKNAKEQCIIISYSADLLKNVHLKTEFSTGYIITLWNDKYLNEAHRLQPEFVICNFTNIPANINYREYSWQLMLYEITEYEQLFYFANLGVQWVEGMGPVN